MTWPLLTSRRFGLAALPATAKSSARVPMVRHSMPRNGHVSRRTGSLALISRAMLPRDSVLSSARPFPKTGLRIASNSTRLQVPGWLRRFARQHGNSGSDRREGAVAHSLAPGLGSESIITGPAAAQNEDFANRFALFAHR